jgi:hypothetical protein
VLVSIEGRSMASFGRSMASFRVMKIARDMVLYRSGQEVVEVAQAKNAGDTAVFPNG